MQVIYDRSTGRSRGFAFVTMSTVEEAEAALKKFDGFVSEGMYSFLELFTCLIFSYRDQFKHCFLNLIFSGN